MDAPAHRLVSDMKAVAADIGELMETAACHSTERLASAGERARAALARVQDGLSAAQRAAVGKARAQTQAADDYVHDSPWRFIGAAALLGAAVAFLLTRR